MIVIWRIAAALSLVIAGAAFFEVLGVDDLAWPLDVLIPGVVILPAAFLLITVAEDLTGRRLR